MIVDKRVFREIRSVRELAKQADAFYCVSAGEPLKELDSFPAHVQKILNLGANLARSRMTVVAVGGGSVGDFAGFVASILRRGVRLVHIPSTWLAALDSSHGGKTALNVKKLKNAIGTFYPADQIFICEEILKNQNIRRAEEAAGELAKIAILSGESWVDRLRSDKTDLQKRMWKYLPQAIEAKYSILEKDPFDLNGIRAVLNLGHTFGHVIEAARGVAHGLAVAQGLHFALKWSLQRDLLAVEEYFEISFFLRESLGLPCWVDSGKWRPIREKEALKFLVQDKKRVSKEKIQFIFVKGWGKTNCQPITVREILKEARRQGWID